MDRARESWLEDLRRHMLGIAARRVPVDEAEDLVQKALQVIVERGDAASDGRPPVAWCLQVLRNVIGNHYRRTATRNRLLDRSVAPETLSRPLESLDTEQRLRTIEEGLAELAAGDDNCGRYLQRMADGEPAREIARDEGLDSNALYQRLYRCRRKLRDILRQKGVLP